MITYYKRKWDETRGDEFDSWGTSTWYFEVENDGYPIRQIEVYQNGNRLKYDRNKMFDDYGGLGDQGLDLLEFKEFEVNQAEFEQEWNITTLKKEHREIIELLSNYLANNYSLRFGQALFNLTINEFVNKDHPEKEKYAIRDIHGDSDNQILQRITNQLEWFKERKKE